MSQGMDNIMLKILQTHSGSVKTPLGEMASTNARDLSAMQGITGGFNDKDRAALGGKLGNLFGNPDEIEAMIVQGNKLLTVSRQVDVIAKKAGITEAEALKIRKKMNEEIITYAANSKNFLQFQLDTAKKLSKEKKEEMQSEIDHLGSLEERAVSEKKILEVVDKQYVSAKNMIKAQLAINVARGKMTLTDAAVGMKRTGHSNKDVVSMAMNAAKVKLVGETAFKRMQKGKSQTSAGFNAVKDGNVGKGAARTTLGFGIQFTALILGAANAFSIVMGKTAQVFAKGVHQAVNRNLIFHSSGALQ